MVHAYHDGMNMRYLAFLLAVFAAGAAAQELAFQVKDPALLAKVKPGDRIKFDAEKRGVGYTITKIEPAK